MQRFSAVNFYLPLSGGPSTSRCESTFSTWSVTGRNKQERLETPAACTSVLQLIIVTNDRIDNPAWATSSKGQGYKPTWRSDVMAEMMSNLQAGNDFNVQEFVERCNGVLCKREIEKALDMPPTTVDIQRDPIFNASNNSLLLEVQKNHSLFYYAEKKSERMLAYEVDKSKESEEEDARADGDVCQQRVSKRRRTKNVIFDNS